MRSTSIISACRRARLLHKVLLAVFCIVFASTVFWAVPWFPGGLSASDYGDRSLLPLLGMAAAAWLTAFGAIYMRDMASRHEQTLATWSSVHDEFGVLRRPESFYERIAVECERTEVTGRRFAIFLSRFDASDQREDGDLTEAAILALNSLVREGDRLAILGLGEIGVLGSGLGEEEAIRVARRLTTALAEEASRGDESRVDVGWAVYGRDGKDAGALVGVARGRMRKVVFVPAIAAKEEPVGLDSAAAA